MPACVRSESLTLKKASIAAAEQSLATFPTTRHLEVPLSVEKVPRWKLLAVEGPANWSKFAGTAVEKASKGLFDLYSVLCCTPGEGGSPVGAGKPTSLDRFSVN